MRTVLCLLFIGLLLLPATLAQAKDPAPVANVLLEGDIELTSRTFYIDLRGYITGSRHLVVEADHLRVELDHDSSEHALPMDLDENKSTALLYDGPGRLVTEEVRREHNLTLVMLDGSATLSTDRLDAVPRSSDEVQRGTGYAQNREKEVWTIGPQFQIKDVGGRLEIAGDFSFTLREWDGVIEHANGRDSFWTGKRYTPPHGALQGSGVPYGGRAEWQAAYVFVENGRLSLDLLRSDDASTYMGSARGILNGKVSIAEDTESASITRFQGRYDTFIEAPAKAELYASFAKPVVVSNQESPPSREPAQVPASEQPPLLDAGPASTPTPTLPDAGLPSWSYLVALPALLLALAVVYLRPILRMRKLENAYDLSLFSYLVDNAPPMLRSRRFGTQASVMYTVALLEEKGPDAAESHLLGVRPRSRPAGATYEFLMARIRAAQTRFDEARRHVHACLTAEPAFVMEIKHNPSLEFLMRPPSDPGEGYT